jgi:hypothetical protein
MISIGTANEKGTAIVTCAFTDEDGTSVVPTSIKWTLVDMFGTVINNRDRVVVTVPAASVNIVLSGNDLLILPREVRAEQVDRFIVIEALYDSSLGVGLPANEEGSFKLRNLKYIT